MGADNYESEELEPLDGLVCFWDKDRPCDASCMAYTTATKSGDELSDQQGHCAFLVGVVRTGKHVVLLASMLQAQMVQARKEQADRSRAMQPSPPIPPVPRGR